MLLLVTDEKQPAKPKIKLIITKMTSRKIYSDLKLSYEVTTKNKRTKTTAQNIYQLMSY